MGINHPLTALTEPLDSCIIAFLYIPFLIHLKQYISAMRANPWLVASMTAIPQGILCSPLSASRHLDMVYDFSEVTSSFYGDESLLTDINS